MDELLLYNEEFEDSISHPFIPFHIFQICPIRKFLCYGIATSSWLQEALQNSHGTYAWHRTFVSQRTQLPSGDKFYR